EDDAIGGEVGGAEDDQAGAFAGAFGALDGDGEGERALGVDAGGVAELGFGAEDAEGGRAPAFVAGVDEGAGVDAGRLGRGGDGADIAPDGLVVHEVAGDGVIGVALGDGEGDGGAAQTRHVDDDVVAEDGAPAGQQRLDADVD